MPHGYTIRGIAPRDLERQPLEVKLLYWSWVVNFGLKAKDRDLSRGIDAEGGLLRPISLATRKHRRSAMTPTGRGDPSAPPLTPGRKLSRTRSLLAGRAFTDKAEFWWRFDPLTHDSWSVILTYQKEQGRDVFGLSDESTQWVQEQALAQYRRWMRAGSPFPEQLRGRTVVAPLDEPFYRPPVQQPATTGKSMEHADLGIGRTSQEGIDWSQWTPGRTEKEWRDYWRGTAPANVQGRAGEFYNRMLQHTWGSPGGEPMAGGSVVPLFPPSPRSRAALKPQRIQGEPEKIEMKPRKPAPLESVVFVNSLLRSLRSISDELRTLGNRVWISDAYEEFYHLHPDVSYSQFKAMLLDAMDKGEVTLESSNPDMLTIAQLVKRAKSQIKDGDASFHWVVF